MDRTTPATSLRRLGPLNVTPLSRQQALQHIESSFKSGKQLKVAYANTNLVTQVHRKPEIGKALNDFLILNDGIGLEIASRIFHKQGFPDNLNGTDFNPLILQSLPADTKVFLYGSRPHVVAKAAAIMGKLYNVNIVGYEDGFTKLTAAELCAKINTSKAEVIFVATGNPRQELWISENAPKLNAKLLVGIGATLDFITGEFPRAPMWMRRLHLEWLFRLMNEPRRLARRYTLDILYFLYICRKHAK